MSTVAGRLPQSADQLAAPSIWRDVDALPSVRSSGRQPEEALEFSWRPRGFLAQGSWPSPLREPLPQGYRLSGGRRDPDGFFRRGRVLERLPLNDFEVEDKDPVHDRNEQQFDKSGEAETTDLRVTKWLPERATAN